MFNGVLGLFYFATLGDGACLHSLLPVFLYMHTVYYFWVALCINMTIGFVAEITIFTDIINKNGFLHNERR